MNEEEIREMQEEAEEREKARQERGGATDEQLTQALKELQNPKDPRREEKFLEERAKRKKAEEEGEDPNIGGTVGGVSFEVAAGLATDKATSFLLNPLLGPKGIALYGLANFASGAVANAIAQRMRGDKSFSLGEILASGAAGVIPGSTIKLKGKVGKALGKAGSLKRATITGAGTAVGSEQIRVGIDEKRVLSAKEALAAAGVGGAASASFNTILKGIDGSLLNDIGYLAQKQSPILQGGGGTSGFIGPKGNYDWTTFGYAAGKAPTIVKRQIGTDFENATSDGLWTFYSRAKEFAGQGPKKGSLAGFGEKFVDPATEKIYYASYTNTKQRFTLRNVAKVKDAARQRRKNDVFSSPFQKLFRKIKNADRAKLNATEEANFNRATKEVEDRLKLLSRRLQDPSIKGRSDLEEPIREQIKKEGLRLDNLILGYHYGEHGHAISSKLWPHLKKMKRFGPLQFLAGDGNNYHLVFEKNKANQAFRNTKNFFETVIDGQIPTATGGKFTVYPDVMVNFNPKLSGTGRKIIRLERLSKLTKGFKDRRGKRYPNMIYGELIAEYDFDQNGPMTPAQIIRWVKDNIPEEDIVQRVTKRKVTPTKGRLSPKEIMRKSVEEDARKYASGEYPKIGGGERRGKITKKVNKDLPPPTGQKDPRRIKKK